MKTRAFTMVEVLVALAIFALGAVVLGTAYVNILNAYATARSAQQRETDLRFARERVLTQADRDEVEAGGDFETAEGGRVRWQALVEATATPDLYRVQLVIEQTPAAGDRARVVEQTLHVLRPDWRVAGEAESAWQDMRDRIREHLDAQERDGR
jgi:general secretion pathway protein I